MRLSPPVSSQGGHSVNHAIQQVGIDNQSCRTTWSLLHQRMVTARVAHAHVLRRPLGDVSTLSYQSGWLMFSAYPENMTLKLMLILVSSLLLASTECANQAGKIKTVPFLTFTTT